MKTIEVRGYWEGFISPDGVATACSTGNHVEGAAKILSKDLGIDVDEVYDRYLYPSDSILDFGYVEVHKCGRWDDVVYIDHNKPFTEKQKDVIVEKLSLCRTLLD